MGSIASLMATHSLGVRSDDGKEVRVHVDTSTNMDKVLRGDRVKAYITDQGHVTRSTPGEVMGR
jgi:translation initiation factor IF-1